RTIQTVRSKREPNLFVPLTLYGFFLAAITYHVLINFIDTGVGASNGWYLYTVIVPEALLVIAGLTAFRIGRQLLVGTIAAFFLLELYTTHAILIPYYTGMIAHTPAGYLQSFYPRY